MQSIREYEKNAVINRPRPLERGRSDELDSLISFEGKDYVSAARAAKLTGYHQDYVGQLARGGTILSRQVGNRWYVDREAIISHKTEKDRLLGALQSQSVGIGHLKPQPAYTPAISDYQEAGPHLRYTSDNNDLIPVHESIDSSIQEVDSYLYENNEETEEYERRVIPIRVTRISDIDKGYRYDPSEGIPVEDVNKSGKTMFYGTIIALALTVVVSITFAHSNIKETFIYANDPSHETAKPGRLLFTASVVNAFMTVGDVLEAWLVTELIYKRF